MWRLVDCIVTRAVRADGSIVLTSASDPLIGMTVFDADSRPPAKIVDLDPQQQMVSQIWELQVRVGRPGSFAFVGEFSMAAFVDIWARVVGPPKGFSHFGASYHSVLTEVAWGSLEGSPILGELRAACQHGLLSIKFNVDGFDGANVGRSGTFGLGRICGTIGVAAREEPARFVAGRHLAPVRGARPTLNHVPAYVDRTRGKVLVDLGNALQTTQPGGPLTALPRLSVGVVGAEGKFTSFGTIDANDAGWYAGTAGVCEVPTDRRLAPEGITALGSNELAVATVSGAGDPTCLAREPQHGLCVRADQFVFRQSPGGNIDVTFRAYKFGVVLPNTSVAAQIDPAPLRNGGDDPPGLPICVPVTALQFPARVRTAATGITNLQIRCQDPRGSGGVPPLTGIDGQVYAITYAVEDASDSTGTNFNGSDFISILLWNGYPIPANPTWVEHIAPIFRQYDYLYPVMKPIVDLGDYDSIVKGRFKLVRALSLPVDDPNYMSVTRDLSPAKLETILKWLGPPDSPIPPAKGDATELNAMHPASLRAMKSGRSS